jgi:hypothetical protein
MHFNPCPKVFTAGVQCATSAFGDEPHLMLRIIQRFGKRCNCHLQGECNGFDGAMDGAIKSNSSPTTCPFSGFQKRPTTTHLP